jgi:hypothetical protein
MFGLFSHSKWQLPKRRKLRTVRPAAAGFELSELVNRYCFSVHLLLSSLRNPQNTRPSKTFKSSIMSDLTQLLEAAARAGEFVILHFVVQCPNTEGGHAES